ncbi:uncharacterized protein PAF06_015929 [Gastrophryne carolinensis]
MKALLILLLPAFFVADVESESPPVTTCNRCWTNDNTKCCGEKEILCKGTTQCMTISEHCELNGQTYETIKKNCAIDFVCGQCFCMTIKDKVIMRIGYECETGNHSNANLQYVRKCPNELPPNGYKCPSCYRNDTDQGCESEGEVLCGGNELECVNFGTYIEQSDGTTRHISGQGCITKGGCDMGFLYMPGVKELTRNFLECKPAIPVEG